jgi:hypothetical protein
VCPEQKEEVEAEEAEEDCELKRRGRGAVGWNLANVVRLDVRVVHLCRVFGFVLGGGLRGRSLEF